MTLFFLVRHAAHDNVGSFLAGRSPGIVLGEAGQAQAARLAERLRRERIAAIHASPRERTQQTAKAIAGACGVPTVETAEALDEIDFGEWSGKTFAELDGDPLWRRWNSERALAQTPAGEAMSDVGRRILGLMETLAAQAADANLVLVSHADVIKAAVCLVLDLSFDAWPRFDVSPASITTLLARDGNARLVTLNEIVP